MATTAVGGDRVTGVALEVYTDAVFVRDDYKFFWGSSGDVYSYWDATNSQLLIGASAATKIRLTDDCLLYFGETSDMYIGYDSTSDCLRISGSTTVRFADDTKVEFATKSNIYFLFDPISDCLFIKGLPIANPAKSDALFISDAGGSDLRVSFG